MIIGCSGKIASGKNLVCKIIQALSCKDDDWFQRETKKAVLEWNGNWDNISNWKQKSFAGKLKQIASLMTGIEVSKFEDQEFKKTYLGEEWNTFIPNKITISEFLENGLGGKQPMQVRTFLQLLGTEAIRNGLHTNAWVNALFADYKSSFNQYVGENEGYYSYPNWIITDVRFENEAQAIKDKGGIVIRVNRLLKGVDNQQTVQLHPSETALDDWKFDYFLENNGTIEELIEEVKKMLEHYEI